MKLNEIVIDEWIDYRTSILDAVPLLEFLLDWLEEEHTGTRAYVIEEMKQEFGIDVAKLIERAHKNRQWDDKA